MTDGGAAVTASSAGSGSRDLGEPGDPTGSRTRTGSLTSTLRLGTATQARGLRARPRHVAEQPLEPARRGGAPRRGPGGGASPGGVCWTSRNQFDSWSAKVNERRHRTIRVRPVDRLAEELEVMTVLPRSPRTPIAAGCCALRRTPRFALAAASTRLIPISSAAASRSGSAIGNSPRPRWTPAWPLRALCGVGCGGGSARPRRAAAGIANDAARARAPGR